MYPFGSLIPNRHGSSDPNGYRYGFNGKEKDNELKGDGNSYDFGARMLDTRIGRWFARDPKEGKYPSLSPYNFVANNPINAIDPDGKDIEIITSKDKKGNINMTIKITGKVIDLTGDKVHVPSYISALKSNIEKEFSTTYANYGGKKVTVQVYANFTEAKSIDDIKKNDYVVGIVNGFNKKTSIDGAPMDKAGIAQLDGNVTLIDKKYKDNFGVVKHEFGHLLGLDHESGTFMNDVTGGGTFMKEFQKQQLFNRYTNDKFLKARNSDRDKLDSGDSKSDLKGLLYDAGAKYSSDELYSK